jgi:hypothetical protein
VRVETVVLIAVIQAAVAIGAFWAFTKSGIAELRKDVQRDRQLGLTERNNIGAIVRDNQRRQERRHKQFLAALIDTHANNPDDIERFSALLQDDSWQ